MIQEENRYLYRVSEYAKLKGLTTQAVYKQVDNKKLEVVKKVDNQKEITYIVVYAPIEAEENKQVDNELTTEKPQVDNEFVAFLMEENRRLSEQNKEVLEQNRELQNKVVSLAEELSQIAKNSQMITSQAQTLHLAEKTQTAEDLPQEETLEREQKKPKFFSKWFKK